MCGYARVHVWRLMSVSFLITLYLSFLETGFLNEARAHKVVICISYFYVVVIKCHEKTNLREKELS